MLSPGLFMIRKPDIPLFVWKETPHFFKFKFFDKPVNIKKSRIRNASTLYVHVSAQRGNYQGALSISADTEKRFEFINAKERDMVQEYRIEGRKFPAEEANMFSNFKVTSIDLRQVDDVAIEVAVEKVAKEIPGVEIVTKSDKTFIVKDGKSQELSGDEFRKVVENYVVGSKVVELQRDSNMFSLIKMLGIIGTATLEFAGDKEDKSSIFG